MGTSGETRLKGTRILFLPGEGKLSVLLMMLALLHKFGRRLQKGSEATEASLQNSLRNVSTPQLWRTKADSPRQRGFGI